MNLISHENTFVRREAIQTYGGFNETKEDVVEYSPVAAYDPGTRSP